MKLKSFLLPVLALLVAACGAPTTPTPAALPPVVDNLAVVADGRLLPAQSLDLSFAAGGQVAQVLVAEGDTVAAGALIAQLKSSQSLQAQVSTAQLNLLSAQQAVKDLQGSAVFATAQAAFAVAQATDALTQTQKDLRNIQNPISERLQTSVSDAKLALDTAKNNNLLGTVDADNQALVQATAQVNILFSAYQNLQAKWDAGDHGAALQKALTLAQSAYQSALDTQTQLQLRIQTDQANGNQTVKDAQKAYDDAVNNQAAAQRGPDADKLAVAVGNVAVAQAAVEQTQAALAQAQTREAALKNGPDPDVLAASEQRLIAAQAQLAAAQAQLAAAQASLDDLDLKASISGTVTDLRIHNGEWVTPGEPVVVLTDLAHLRVETTDLSERDVPQVSVGQTVAVMVKALNQNIPGQVTEIAPLADTLGGDVVYKTTIELSTRPAGLRAGMSVDVQFGAAP